MDDMIGVRAYARSRALAACAAIDAAEKQPCANR
jgi:hypothetical protein